MTRKFEIRAPEWRPGTIHRTRLCGHLLHRSKGGWWEIKFTLREAYRPPGKDKRGFHKIEEANRKRALRIAIIFKGILLLLKMLGYKIKEVRESTYSRAQAKNRKRSLVDEYLEELEKSLTPVRG